MAPLALRNLLHDKVRLLVTLAGIVFAIILMGVQVGLFLGMTQTTSCVIDHSNADVWIGARGVPYFDAGSPVLERTLYEARRVVGVAEAQPLIVRFSNWKLPGGGEEVIEVVGFQPGSKLGAPWALTAGSLADLRLNDTVIIDEDYRGKLGVSAMGQELEINGRRARVAGFTRGIRSFTTAPFVFCSYRAAQEYAAMRNESSTYVLVKAEPGLTPELLQARLRASVPDVDIYTREQFSRKTQNYWMFTTGAGIALLVAAGLGFIVGIVVVGQTLYAATMDHQREFGTLKAIGATNGFVFGVIVRQALYSAVAGYAVGAPSAWFISHVARQNGAAIFLPATLLAALFVTVVLMCTIASAFSFHRVVSLDPAMVFRT